MGLTVSCRNGHPPPPGPGPPPLEPESAHGYWLAGAVSWRVVVGSRTARCLLARHAAAADNRARENRGKRR